MVKVIRVEHGPELWPLLGPFMADKEVHKELGGAICSDPNHVWFVALDSESVVGFCGILVTDKAYILHSAYVVKDRRDQGIGGQLANARDEYLTTLPPRPVRSVIRNNRWADYEKSGFTIQRQRGEWLYIIREAKNA